MKKLADQQALQSMPMHQREGLGEKARKFRATSQLMDEASPRTDV